MKWFEVRTRELVDRTYLVEAVNESVARVAFEGGAYASFTDHDATVEEIVSVKEKED